MSKTQASLKELESQIKDLFEEGFLDDPKIELTGKPGDYSLTVSAMYEPPKFKNGTSFLNGLTAIRDILGTQEFDTLDYIRSGGCPTCDYGSEYGYVFMAWDKE